MSWVSCCSSGRIKVSKKENLRNQQIEVEIEKSRLAMQKEVKLLLLGAGESGKSTVAKQLRIIHNKPFTKQEIESYRPIVFINIINNISALCKAMNKLEIKFADNSLLTDKENIIQLSTELYTNEVELTEEIAESIEKLWSDKGIQECWTRRSEYQIGDSAAYFLDNLERYKQEDFVPTQEDVVYSRIKTTGIVQTTFNHEDLTIKMFDLGGQRCERRKWLHCFENVTAVIFCVAMSEYDQTLYEDESHNRMHESLILFQTISNSDWLNKTSMILFLNKKDLFAEKIKTSPLTIAFPEYTGENEYEEASDYIRQQFQKLAPHNKDIYTHKTCATDTENVSFVFKSVSNIIIKEILSNYCLV